MRKHKNLFGAVCVVLFALGCTAKATTLDFGPNAGSEIWYVGDLSGPITIPAQGLGGQKYGLSGWTLFGPGAGNHVPDDGATAALLGLGLVGMAGLWARFGRN